MYEKIQETASFLKERMTSKPETAIILGSGLGHLADEIEVETEIAYSEIPNMPVSTVEGHSGKMLFGKLGGKEILAMQGRFHYYEGYSMKEVTFPVRVMYELGIKNLFVSNAAGGMNPAFHVGDLLVLNDHINMFPEHPLRGKNFPTGPRFPSMHQAYDPEFIKIVEEAAEKLGIKIFKGVYLGTQGPTFETPAEYRMFRGMGADAVGMSTVPEVIVAVHCGIRVFGISVITDLGGFDEAVKVSHEEVQAAADAAQPRMTALMKELVKRV
ncbi:MAG: purine-nucleoside phosphorylase [Bacteroidaceae bacterium]|jgi:purine-nucleoside phosphorylase|nr:purine-nucleoside phosphorylase [Bacteroidaceae bacterium]